MLTHITAGQLDVEDRIGFGSSSQLYVVVRIERDGAGITLLNLRRLEEEGPSAMIFDGMDFLRSSTSMYRLDRDLLLPAEPAPLVADEGLIVEGSETPEPDEWSAVEEIRAAQQDAVTVELPRSETTDHVRDLLAGFFPRGAAEPTHPSIDGHTADGTPLQHKTARQVLADAMLGKPMLSNGKPIGTIIETSVDEDGVRFVLQKNPDHPFPLLRSVGGIGIPPRGFDFNTTYGRMEPRIAYPGVSIHRDGGISVDGRGILTGVFGQGDGALYWQKTSAPAVKPEPTFTLTQLKSAVKKARKRARRSALREVLGFINNNLHPNGAQRSLLDMFFGKQVR